MTLSLDGYFFRLYESGRKELLLAKGRVARTEDVLKLLDLYVVNAGPRNQIQLRFLFPGQLGALFFPQKLVWLFWFDLILGGLELSVEFLYVRALMFGQTSLVLG